jgi:seryl-tRNA synthetase
MSDSEDERLAKIIEESKIAIKDAEAKLDERKQKRTKQLEELKLEIENQLENERKIFTEMQKLHKEYSEVNKEIIEKIEKMQKLLSMTEKNSGEELEEEKFAEEMRQKTMENFEEWSKIFDDEKKALWSMIYLALE